MSATPDNRSYALYSACGKEEAVQTSGGIENLLQRAKQQVVVLVFMFPRVRCFFFAAAGCFYDLVLQWTSVICNPLCFRAFPSFTPGNS